ncbi:hypothetical protein XENOCAPTIV_026538, partial [Xenoophorus captivus]
AKKAKIETDGEQETEQSNLSADGTPAAVLASSQKDGSYSALSTAQLDAENLLRQELRDAPSALAEFQPSTELTSRCFCLQVKVNRTSYSSSPAVTSYTSQVAFPPLAQSTVYSSFPQSGQTYGLPPFGSSFTTSSVYSNIPSATAISSASAAAGPQVETGDPVGCSSHPSHVNLFLSFLQDFSSYSSLGQTQFSQYYQLPPNYTPAGLTSSDEHSAGAGVAGYSAVKSEEAAPAGLPPRGSLPSSLYVKVL